MVLNSKASCRTARSNTELVVDGADVGVDGAGTEHQLFGYLEIGQATCQQAQHLHFSCRQSGGIGR